jgi:hypothetical protein
MKSTLARFVCRILAASMIFMPFHAQAGLIGTDQASRADRGAVAGQLQAYGLSHEDAMARVAALTDAEVASLAGRIDALPAGGLVGVLPILVIIFLFWRLTASDQAKAEAAKSAPKPAAKPAPEKK